MHKKIRILILEDRATDADLMEFELMEAGFDFVSKRTKNEEEYLKALKEFSPDLILSDYDLPQYSGALALAAAKVRLPNVPFILVTGELNEEPAMIRGMLASGACDFVCKCRLTKLAPAVHNALGSVSQV
jgi:DNA-binding NtrC family response regulator